MQKIDYILCHGSGNRFILINAVAQCEALNGMDIDRAVPALCRLCGGTDGLLLFDREVAASGSSDSSGAEFAMRMYNPDGTEAEMCGNGIRCVARMARDYVADDRFALWSGGRRYAVGVESPLYGDMPTFGADIPVRLSSDDFTLATRGEFVGRAIEDFFPELRFTYLNLGNPHLVAVTPDYADRDLLTRLGESVVERRDLFPRGINVSLIGDLGGERIFVATYERGAGITASCGTAMTASSTAACLLGVCHFDTTIEVVNRGGMVRCRCRRDGEGLTTRLIGNATFYAEGSFLIDTVTGEVELSQEPEPRMDEIDIYDKFCNTLK